MKHLNLLYRSLNYFLKKGDSALHDFTDSTPKLTLNCIS